MAYLSEYQYYENDGNSPREENWGSYQYVSLKDIVNNFLLMYTGDHSVVNNEERYKVLFHAKRAVQELNYDAFKEMKVLELSVDDKLRFILPKDYVNWVRVSAYNNGSLTPLTENRGVQSSDAYLQSQTGDILFDINGNILKPQSSDIDFDRISNATPMIYNGGGQFNGQCGCEVGGKWYFSFKIGAKSGGRPTFTIDRKAGVINFSSDMAEQVVILEYVSDGMEGGDNSKITVNKLFEDYIYAEIEYSILNSKKNIQEYVIRRAKKRRKALLNNAKIRISNIHPGKLLLNMR